jgi:methylglutaconyl-CoA hydratase
MNASSIKVERHAAARIELNRPELRNAFNETMIQELTDAFSSLGADPGVRVIVLAAAGRAFCAGADLNWMKRMASYSDEDNQRDAAGLARMLEVIYRCDKPVIARINGDCYAGGMGLISACDVAIATHDAHFCLSEVRLGLIPSAISPYVMRAIGPSAARRYFLTAERFDAAEALRIGLIHAALPADELDTCVTALTSQLLGNSPNAMKEAKRLIRDVAFAPLNAALAQDTAHRIASIRASAEGREGVAAFLEKRKPSWASAVPDAS